MFRILDFKRGKEWRYPYSRDALQFNHEDVFVGLCPDDEIEDFEARFPRTPLGDQATPM